VLPAPLVALALALPAGALAAERSLDLGLELLSGVDGNPARALGPGSKRDAFLQPLARLRGELAGDGWRGSLALDEGLRLFAQTPSARAVASRLAARGALELGAGFAAALAASGSDLTERGGRLDQDALRGEALLSWRTDAAGASLSGGWSRFAPRDAPLRRFATRGPEGWLRGWIALAGGHRLEVGAQLARAEYPRWREAAPPGQSVPARIDDALGLAAEWAWRGPLVGALGYGFTRNGSNVGGGDYRRHQVALRAAVPLGGEAVLVARAALQWTRRPEALVAPGEQLRVEAGREELDLADLRATLPLARDLDLVLGAAGQWSEGSAAGLPSYRRLLFTLGASWRARWEPGAGAGSP